MVSVTWQSWLSAPKSAKMSIQLKKYCMQNNIEVVSMSAEDNHRDLFDKMLGISQETIFFTLKGEKSKIMELQKLLLSLEKT